MNKKISVLAAICIASTLFASDAYSSAAVTTKKIKAADLLKKTNSNRSASHNKKAEEAANEGRPQTPDTGHRRRPSFKVNQPIAYNALRAQDVFDAIDANDEQSVRHILLDTVIDPDSIDVFGASFLQRAIDKDNFLIVKTLLRFGATPIDVPENMAQKNTALIKDILNEYILLRTRAK